MNTECTIELYILCLNVHSASSDAHTKPIVLSTVTDLDLPLIPVGHRLSVGEEAYFLVHSSHLDIVDNTQFLVCRWHILYSETAELEREKLASLLEQLGYKRRI